MRTVETINAIIMALFFLCYSYPFVYLAIGLFAKPKKAEAAAPHRRIAVLIAARNEEAVIGQLLDSVRAQNYPPELLDAIDPVPFGNHAMREEQGCFTSKGYLTLSGDEWEHERPRERQTEKKPSIKERLEQSRKECANQSKAQPHREKPAPER